MCLILYSKHTTAAYSVDNYTVSAISSHNISCSYIVKLKATHISNICVNVVNLYPFPVINCLVSSLRNHFFNAANFFHSSPYEFHLRVTLLYNLPFLYHIILSLALYHDLEIIIIIIIPTVYPFRYVTLNCIVDTTIDIVIPYAAIQLGVAGILLIQIRKINMIGANTDPWGTPLVQGDAADDAQFYRTKIYESNKMVSKKSAKWLIKLQNFASRLDLKIRQFVLSILRFFSLN